MTTTQKQRGNLGERLAKIYLQKKGYEFIVSNFSCRMGEVDLIFKDNDVWVFVEVKLRTGTAYWPHEAVHRAKQRRLIRTGELFLQRRRLLLEVDWRFDVVEILLHEKRARIRHLQNVIEGST